MLENVRAATSELGDPKSAKSMQPAYCKNETRSIKPDVFVAVGLCTHLGCSPRPIKETGFYALVTVLGLILPDEFLREARRR